MAFRNGGMTTTPKVAKQTLETAIRRVPDTATATRLLASTRWPDGPVCPRCGTLDRHHYFLKTRNLWKCRVCKKQFSAKTGTIYEDSPVELEKWLAATWAVEADNGISSYELQRQLGVTQKTGWLMMQRIKSAIAAGTIELPKAGQGQKLLSDEVTHYGLLDLAQGVLFTSESVQARSLAAYIIEQLGGVEPDLSELTVDIYRELNELVQEGKLEYTFPNKYRKIKGKAR